MSGRSAGGFTRLYEILRRSPHPVTVIDRYPSIYADLSRTNVTLIEYRLPTSFLADRLFTPFLLIWQVLLQKSSSPLILYVPFSELPQLTLAGALLKFLTGSPLVLTNLNVNTYTVDRLVNVVLHRFADRIITLSRDLQANLRAVGISAGFINGVGFDPQAYRRPAPAAKKKYHAVFVGRHIPEKGLWDLLAAWRQVVAGLPSAVLVTAGDVPDYLRSQIDEYLAKSGLQKNVILLGQLSESGKIRLFHQSRICLFPSRQEGWGIVPQEALACGLPVVAYRLPVYRESLGASSAIRLVPVGDTRALAETALDTLAHLARYRQAAGNWSPPVDWDTVSAQEWAIICRP